MKKNTKTKSRYYYILAKDKNEKKEIRKNIKVNSLPYPKGDNTKYEMGIFGEFSTIDNSKLGQKDETELKYQVSIFDLL